MKSPLVNLMTSMALFCLFSPAPAVAQGDEQKCVIIKTDGQQKIKAPLGLPDLEVPEDNPMTPEKVALGKRLYFDPRLSYDNTVSCVPCHDLR
ncbi:MAG: cytochrome c peroxidase, partial [Candidatus Brocadiales bacterium]|nr:cytochrome c peroxidase [Candidatus Brocadiales bacterium]